MKRRSEQRVGRDHGPLSHTGELCKEGGRERESEGARWGGKEKGAEAGFGQRGKDRRDDARTWELCRRRTWFNRRASASLHTASAYKESMGGCDDWKWRDSSREIERDVAIYRVCHMRRFLSESLHAPEPHCGPGTLPLLAMERVLRASGPANAAFKESEWPFCREFPSFFDPCAYRIQSLPFRFPRKVL